jgi:hypothetical protein
MDDGRHFERYKGTFVMLASELSRFPHPDPCYHLDPKYNPKCDSLSTRLKKESYKPWQHHLSAEVSHCTWQKKVNNCNEELITLENGLQYTHLKFNNVSSSEIHITEGITFFEFARSREQQSWVVVDVFLDGEFSSRDVTSPS